MKEIEKQIYQVIEGVRHPEISEKLILLSLIIVLVTNIIILLILSR